MDTAATALAVLLAVVLTASALGKLTEQQPVVTNLDKAAVPHSMYPLLATIQLVGSLGLVVGVWVPWAGIAAGAGFFLYFLLAAGFHVRAGDARGIGVPLALGVTALAEAALRAAA